MSPAPCDPGPIESRLVYTVPEAAQLLGISKWSYYEGIKKGDLPFVRLGIRLFVPKIQFEAFLAGSWARPA